MAPTAGPSFGLIDASSLNFEGVELYRDFGNNVRRWRVVVSEEQGNIFYFDTQAKDAEVALGIVHKVASVYQGLSHADFLQRRKQYQKVSLMTSVGMRGDKTVISVLARSSLTGKREVVAQSYFGPQQVDQLKQLGHLFSAVKPAPHQPVAPLTFDELKSRYAEGGALAPLLKELKKPKNDRRAWFIEDQIMRLNDNNYKGLLCGPIKEALGENTEQKFLDLDEDTLRLCLRKAMAGRSQLVARGPIFCRLFGDTAQGFAALDANWDYEESSLLECLKKEAEAVQVFNELEAQLLKPDTEKDMAVIREQTERLENRYPALKNMNDDELRCLDIGDVLMAFKERLSEPEKEALTQIYNKLMEAKVPFTKAFHTANRWRSLSKEEIDSL